ncbi:hypothetical protein [Mycobacterium sp. UM_CSW]|uniref:hypothetical protein n=1 Tax=Mycobacterium sp. UM_CSW TaxID=1370119 RepID=UPI000420BEAA|nr:hypothetical protein [Mycobacterium sp. UM_CSW]
MSAPDPVTETTVTIYADDGREVWCCDSGDGEVNVGIGHCDDRDLPSTNATISRASAVLLATQLLEAAGETAPTGPASRMP